MTKSILFASAAAIALSASVAMAGGVSQRALHNLRAPGQPAVHRLKVPPPGTGFKNDWAVVNGDGSIARGKHVASVSRLGTGIYIIDFMSDKTACEYNATVGLSGSSGIALPGYATVVGANGDANGVFLDTYTTGGTNADTGFHLYMRC